MEKKQRTFKTQMVADGETVDLEAGRDTHAVCLVKEFTERFTLVHLSLQSAINLQAPEEGNC